MRGCGPALLACLLLGVVQGGLGSRNLQQTSNLPNSRANSPGGNGVFACYPPLAVIAQLNSTANNLTYFSEALYYTGLIDLLLDPLAPLTVLAPNDAAFIDAADMLGMEIEDLINSPVAIPVLLNHIIGLPLLSEQLSSGDFLPTLLTLGLNVSVSEGSLDFSSVAATAEVINADNCNCDLCTNVVDVIDTVLLPNILNITSEGTKTTIRIGGRSGVLLTFVVLDLSGTLATPKAAPVMAPAVMVNESQTPTTMSDPLAPTASGSTRGTTTSTGMTYFMQENS